MAAVKEPRIAGSGKRQAIPRAPTRFGLGSDGNACYLLSAMKTIIAALDFSNSTEGILSMAKELAKGFGAGLHLLHVLEPEPTYTAYGFTPDEFPAIHAFQQEARKRAEEKLAAMVENLKPEVAVVEAHLTEGSPLQGIIDLVKAVGGDLVILGSHGHGVVASLLLGSVAEGMVRKATVPTLVVPAPGKGRAAAA
jgi:nucleotide-binding universal stress UspA family protein